MLKNIDKNWPVCYNNKICQKKEKERREKKSLGRKIKEMKTWKKIVILAILIIALAAAIIIKSAADFAGEIVEEMHEPISKIGT